MGAARPARGDAKRDRLKHGFRLAQDETIGGAALAAFDAWFAILAGHCWRDLYLHRAPCPCLSGDELAMLDLVASAQADDEARVYRPAAGLVQARALGLLMASSRDFAVALRALGLLLTRRPTRPASALLH